MSVELEQLVAYIRSETGYQGDIAPDDDLLEAKILDSFSIVSLAVFAQQVFGVEFEAEDMVRENLARLSALVDLVNTRRA